MYTTHRHKQQHHHTTLATTTAPSLFIITSHQPPSPPPPPHRQDEEDEEEGAAEAATDAEVRARMDVDAGDDTTEGALNVQDIDAYWLQRQLTKAFESIQSEQAQQMAEEVLGVLETCDKREAENRLVMLLDFDKFELIKMLLANQVAIVWCTKLARTQVCVVWWWWWGMLRKRWGWSVCMLECVYHKIHISKKNTHPQQKNTYIIHDTRTIHTTHQKKVT